MVHARQQLGALGEEAAANWYIAKGFEIVGRNWRNGRSGEIDLIARLGRQCVFCEVKTRSSVQFGTGFEAVTEAKQRRVRGLAMAWLAARRESGTEEWLELRFDVAAVDPSGSVEVLEGAF